MDIMVHSYGPFSDIMPWNTSICLNCCKGWVHFAKKSWRTLAKHFVSGTQVFKSCRARILLNIKLTSKIASNEYLLRLACENSALIEPKMSLPKFLGKGSKWQFQVAICCDVVPSRRCFQLQRNRNFIAYSQSKKNKSQRINCTNRQISSSCDNG